MDRGVMHPRMSWVGGPGSGPSRAPCFRPQAISASVQPGSGVTNSLRSRERPRSENIPRRAGLISSAKRRMQGGRAILRRPPSRDSHVPLDAGLDLPFVRPLGPRTGQSPTARACTARIRGAMPKSVPGGSQEGGLLNSPGARLRWPSLVPSDRGAVDAIMLASSR